MTSSPEGILVIGYGNPGRLDDGLGPAAADALGRLGLPGVTVDCDYQLTVEDAEAAARHRVVVFVDAAVAGAEPFFFRRVEPCTSFSFSTHSCEPEAVVGMAHDLFHAPVDAWALGIRGYEFDEFGERLSERARANLDEAVAFLVGAIRDGVFREVRADGAPRRAPLPD